MLILLVTTLNFAPTSSVSATACNFLPEEEKFFEPKNLEIANDLDRIVSSFSEEQHEFVRRVIYEKIPRLEFGVSVLNDLVFTYDFILQKYPDQNDDFRFDLVRLFHDYQLDAHFTEIRLFLIRNLDEMAPIFERTIGAQKFWEHHAVCPQSNPYHFFGWTLVAKETRKKDGILQKIDTRKLFDKYPIRTLYGSETVSRRYYHVDAKKALIRYIFPPCGDGNQQTILDFRLARNDTEWSQDTFPYEIGQWPMKGLDDYRSKLSQADQVYGFETRAMFYAKQRRNETVLLEKLNQYGYPMKLPEVDPKVCDGLR